jgi:DTW domain-containing protein YfiP
VLNDTHIVVLQHPDETKVAKNTVRLLQLQLKNIQVHIGECQNDFLEVFANLPLSQTAILYPDKTAIDASQFKTLLPKPTHLIVVDGTWKKTNKILALNPWLHSLQKISFNVLPENNYRIRKAEQVYSLSTLEAVGHFLSIVENKDNRPLLNLLNGMIEQQTKFMPPAVKARYLKE